MTQQSTTKGHPRGLYILFATEMWERFNFYGMRAVLFLFMTQALLFENKFASNLYGSYIGMIYLSPLIGGYIADRYWGNQRSIIAGGIIMAIGEVFLFFCGSLYQSSPGLAQAFFYSGLGFMITGNGFFKPNISSLVGQLYPHGDHRKDAAYTIFYMGINTGGAIGPLVCGLVGNTGNPADFKWAFLVGGIAMVISVIVQLLFHKKYVLDPDKKTLGMIPADCPKKFLSLPFTVIGLAIISAVIVGLFYIDAKVFSYMIYLLMACFIIIPLIIYSDKSLTKKEKDKVAVITIVCFFVIFFWGAYEQTGASLVLFAEEQTDRFLGLKIPSWVLYTLSAAFMYYIFTLFKRTARNFSSPVDRTLRLTIFFLLFLLTAAIIAGNIFLIAFDMNNVSISEIPTSWFQSLNSIFIVLFAPFFAWFWLKLGKNEPTSPTKMALGLFFVALGYLWIAWGVKSAQPGIKVSMIWLTVLYALHTAGELCLSPIGLSLVNKLSPLKFASLLMAVWFTANAFGNKIAGSLSALYPEKGSTTSFLGYHMSNLYDFFMLFVFMCGIAALILFILTRKLQKMMNE
ncbi:MAG: peptide MFS transporter [Chitinophagaceae bacterium]|nr:peptide MFS transporter [Chitinophagaceae bacterium]